MSVVKNDYPFQNWGDYYDALGMSLDSPRSLNKYYRVYNNLLDERGYDIDTEIVEGLLKGVCQNERRSTRNGQFHY